MSGSVNAENRIVICGVLFSHSRVGHGFKAIVAMSRNRVIGKDNKLPWHLPEDLRWFKRLTTGNVIIMGRKTWDSIGKPLPNRENIVLSRSGAPLPGARTIRSLAEVDPSSDPRDFFLIGGAQIFAEYIACCSDIFLTLVKREVEGDVFLPEFEHDFFLAETIQDTPEFAILHYKRLGAAATPC